MRDFRQFAAWQRAEELRRLAEAFLARPGVRVRFRSADQLADAAASGPRNIAEGFGRFRPKEFGHFVRIAKASEMEVLNIFITAQTGGFLTEPEFRVHETAARRAIGTAIGLIRYLESSDGPGQKGTGATRGKRKTIRPAKSNRTQEPRNPGT